MMFSSIVVCFWITCVTSVPLYTNFTRAAIGNSTKSLHFPVTVLDSISDLGTEHGLVYLRETDELCGEDTTFGAEEVDAQKLPKMGEKKYCVSGLSGTKLVSQKALAVPVTHCLDSSLGDGGSITKGISVSLALTGAINPGLAEPLFNFISLSAGITTGLTVGLSFSHSCTAAAGDSIQMWFTPIVGVTNFRYRTYHKLAGQKHSYSDYKTVSNFQFPVGGLQSAVECYKSEFVNCGALVTRTVEIPVNGL